MEYRITHYYSRLILSIISFFILGVLTGLPSVPVFATTLAGSTSAEFRVSESGAATYTIPLTIPTGIAGLTPQLSLAYDSQNGNGLLGQGWQLEGLSTIIRCRPTLDVEGHVNAEPTQFCLDGQKLILVSSHDYGANGAEYRTEVDSYQKIVSYGSQNGYPSWFKVWRKDGSVSEYGNTDDSRIEGQGSSIPMAWAINSTQDSLQNSNNRILFSYTENSTDGEFFLNNITYAGGQVVAQMHYGSRADIRIGYSAGFKSSMKHRLERIAIHQNNYLYREYNLQYQGGTEEQQSQITSITECVNTGCLPSIRFDWGRSGSYEFSPVKKISFKNNFSYAKIADLDANGLKDIIIATEINNETTLFTYYGQNDSLVQKGSGINLGNIKKEDWQLFDYNGDSFTDLIFKDNDTWKIHDGSSNGFTHEVFDTGVISDNAYLADHNGDGLVDLIYNSRASSGYKFTGEGRSLHFLESRNIQYLTLGTDTPSTYPYRLSPAINETLRSLTYSGHPVWPIQTSQKIRLDFDGDGRIDRFEEVAVPGSNNSFWVIATDKYSNGQYTTQLFDREVVGGENAIFIDVNGDGLPDKIDQANKNSNSFNIYLNTGKGFVYFAPFNLDMTNPEIVNSLNFHDNNNDGINDVHFVYNKVHSVKLWTGSGYGTPQWMRIEHIADKNNYFLDINGDGEQDYIHIAKDGNATLQMATTSSGYEGKIKSIVSGIGLGVENRTDIQYKALTNPAVYTKASDSAQLRWGACKNNQCSPVFDRVGALYVVSEVASSAPTEEDVLKFTPPVCDNYNPRLCPRAPAVEPRYSKSKVFYQYANARIQSGGRGFLGYEKLITTDAQTGVITETRYHQDFPYAGMPKSTTVHTANGQLLTESTNNWAHKKTDNTYQVYLRQSQEFTYDMNTGNQLKAVTTTQDIDNYGNIVTMNVDTQGQGDAASITTINQYTNNATSWHLGRLIYSSVTSTINGHSDTRTSSFEYSNHHGMLTSETIEPGNSQLSTTKTYSYDSVGNTISTTLTGYGIPSHTTSTSYTSDGWYITSQRNTLDQVTSEVLLRDDFGHPLKVADINGTVTTFTYDALGRKTSERHASGSGTDYAYFFCQQGRFACPMHGATVLEVNPVGGIPSWEVHDILGRVIRKATTGFDGSLIFVDSHYDSLSRLAKVSEPYKAGSTVYWNTLDYDLLGRIISQTNASGHTETTQYLDNTAKTINPLGQYKTEVRNVLGQLIQVIDNLNNTIDYTYDAQGNLTRTLQTAADTGTTAETTITYDSLGRKIAMDDEDKGLWHYQYNMLGQLTEQTDAKGQKTQFTYDLLGRKLTRIDRRVDGSIEGHTHWTYDQGTLGVLSKTKDTVSGYEQQFSYDSYGRPKGTTTRFDGETYQQHVTYDWAGRLATEIDAAGASSGVRYEYNNQGFMAAIFDLETNQEWYRVNSMDARGNLTVQTIGGIQQAKYYNPLTGFLESIRASYSLALDDETSIQNQEYQWDAIGNLIKRSELHAPSSYEEVFEYDGLNRLTQSSMSYQRTVKGNTNEQLAEQNYSVIQRYRYNGLGNITYKTGVGDYTYGQNGAGAHAVTHTSETEYSDIFNKGIHYQYDTNGNMVSGGGRTVDYSTYNKALSIRKGNTTIEFAYDVNRNRFKQINKKSGSTQSVTHYVGNVEIVIDSNDEKTIKRHIHGIVIQTINKQVSSVTGETSFRKTAVVLMKDHLGSVNVAVSALPASTGSFEIVISPVKNYDSFDPFGQRRHSLSTLINDAYPNLYNSPSIYSSAKGLNRGFTGHEQLEDVGLIHMNGRIYDPKLGRFLQADPFIQAASNTQSFNRYSYVMNNPLNAVDPSGFFFKAIARAFKRITRSVIKKAAKIFGTEVVNFVGTVVAGVAGAGTWSAATIAIWNYEFGRAMGASSGQAFKSAAIAGASAFAFQAIGSKFTGKAGSGFWAEGGYGHIAAHATTGGIIAELQGGKFGHGFISAGFTKFAMSNMMPDVSLDDSWQAISGRTAIAAAIGGTASALTGGKFANGAMTTAIAHLYNSDQSRRRQLAQSRANQIVAEVEKRGNFLGKGEADLIYQLNSNPEMAITVDAAKLTVTSDGDWGACPGGASGACSAGYMDGADYAVHGQGTIRHRPDDTYGFYDQAYDYEMHADFSPRGIARNFGTFFGSPPSGWPNTPFQIQYRGNINITNPR